MSSKVGCLVMNDSEPPLAALNGWVAPFVEVAEDEGDDLIVPVTNVLLAHAAKGDRKQRHVAGARAASSTHGGIAPKPPHKMNVLEAPTSVLQSERESILKQLEIFGDRCECLLFCQIVSDQIARLLLQLYSVHRSLTFACTSIIDRPPPHPA